jgi:hypothetical protein
MFKQFAAAVGLSLIAATSFAAGPTGFYGGLDVGSAKIDGLGDRQAGAGAFLGYGFNTYVAFELGYRHLGSFDVAGTDVPVNQTHLSVVGSFPLNQQFDLYGRLGHDYVRGDTHSGGTTYSVKGDSGLLGVGLSARFAPNLSGRVEAQRLAKGADNIGVGIVYQF